MSISAHCTGRGCQRTRTTSQSRQVAIDVAAVALLQVPCETSREWEGAMRDSVVRGPWGISCKRTHARHGNLCKKTCQPHSKCPRDRCSQCLYYHLPCRTSQRCKSRNRHNNRHSSPRHTLNPRLPRPKITPRFPTATLRSRPPAPLRPPPRGPAETPQVSKRRPCSCRGGTIKCISPRGRSVLQPDEVRRVRPASGECGKRQA